MEWSAEEDVQAELLGYLKEVISIKDPLRRAVRALKVIEYTAVSTRIDSSAWQHYARSIAQASETPDNFWVYFRKEDRVR